MSEVDAVIGNWYQMPGGQVFEVVALDEHEGCIEIQHFDGEVDELENEVWYEMPLVVVEPPDDCTGAYESMDDDDMGYGEAILIPDGFSVSLTLPETGS